MIIKRYPEDFFVEEILTPEAGRSISAETGACTLHRLTKRGLGTDEAVERVARTLRVPVEEIGYVGLKDKHALTVQYISIERPAAGSRTLPPSLARACWSIEKIGWIEKRLEPEDVAGNRFRVTMRNLTRRQCALVEDGVDFLAASPGRRRTLRFPNYFGEQRFGSARHGRGFAAKHLIHGEFEEALRLIIAAPSRKDSREAKLIKRALEANWGSWKRAAEKLPTGPARRCVERLASSDIHYRAAFAALPAFIRRMTIEAYQSWLWNRIAPRVISEQCAPPFIEIPTKFGALVFPRGAAVSGELDALVVPLLSPGTSLKPPWRSAAKTVLDEEGIDRHRLHIPGLREPYFGETPRTLFVEAEEFSLGPIEHDESIEDKRRFKRRLKFFLPRGAYGTVLLRALGGDPQSTLT